MNRIYFAWAACCALMLMACDRHPIDRIIDPAPSSMTGVSSGRWLIFGDELRTGGAIMFLTTDEGTTLDLTSPDRPAAGNRCIRFSWNGSEVKEYSSGNRQSGYVGFMFIAAPTLDAHATVTRDLSAGKYTKVRFYARGSLNTNVYLRVEGNSAVYTTPSGTNCWMSNTSDRALTADWQLFEFALSGQQTAVRDFFRVVLRYDEDGDPDTANTAAGNGGTIYLDEIEYVR